LGLLQGRIISAPDQCDKFTWRGKPRIDNKLNWGNAAFVTQGGSEKTNIYSSSLSPRYRQIRS
jgi:hypothetical protein